MNGLRRGVSLLVILIATGLAGHAGADELRGVALVIGEADYETLGDLGNTLNDARAMDEMLDTLGFDVSRVLDRDSTRLRREIADFIEDAEGADVALVYYAGHAVEAAGQNYLVPIDADIGSPKAAGESLVAVADLLDELAKTVPVTIMLLDACRSEAFPNGAAIQLPGSDAPVPLSPTGLGEMRGPAPVAKVNVAPDSLGMVIGFAAAPGRPALDGEPGGNSPYAAALLKHLGAGGYAFGDLMTLVTEEVYLKTGARQIPWMNSSLRRVLSFGAPIESSGDDESLIRDGRRKLLLSIAALPSDVRAQVQTAAADAAVPMDTLYGLLDALGTDAPESPEALDQLLRAQTDALRQIMDERRALNSTDPEITRLAGLAQRALDEGAMQVSVGFWEQAKARYQRLSTMLDATETQLEQRRREGGALLASVADTYVLSGDYAAAAENFGLAFAEIERWDDALALAYRGKQADALFRQGDQQGDNSAIERAIALYHEMAGDMAPTDEGWGELQSGLGSAYAQLGERTGNLAFIRDGVEAFRAAVASYDRATEPSRWANAQGGLATALSIAANTNTDPAELQGSIDAYRAALEILTPGETPRDWARAQGNLGAALTLQGRRDGRSETFDAAAVAIEAAMRVDTLERAPLGWANLQDRLGTVLMLKAQSADDAATFRDAIAAYREALTVATRDKAPLQWASTQGNLATALWQLGEATNDVALVEEAIATYKASLAELTPERSLNDWALALSNMAAAQMAVGRALSNADYVRASADTYREALSRYDREQGALLWALLQGNRSATLNVLGQIENAPAPFVESEAAARASLEVRTRDTGALEWASSQSNLGDALAGQARFTDGTDLIVDAVAAYRAALEIRDSNGPPGDRANTQMLLGDALFELGLRENVGVERYSDALDAYGAAADYYAAANQPLDYATIADKAGWVLANIGFRLQSRDAFGKARDAVQSAWDKVKASGQSQHDAHFAERIGMIDDALNALPP